MIEGGTFQVGLTVMYFIVSTIRGVAWLPTLPTTTRVVQACWSLCITFSVKSGMLRITWALPIAGAPSWRGSQRQRSMLTISVSMWRSRFGVFIARTVASSSTPVTFRSLLA